MSTNPDAEKLGGKLRRDGSLILDIKVTPRARASEVLGLREDGVLKVKVTAPPEGGKANAEVCAVLADYFEVSKGNVEILLGGASSQKRVRITANKYRAGNKEP